MDNDLKMLFQVQQGDIIHVVGRLLRPFCSHALYRVGVTDLHDVGHGCFVVQGQLIDFNDSPVQSYALPRLQMFRVEDQDKPQPKLTKEDIERIVRSQGISVAFRKVDGAVRVQAWKYLCVARTKQGRRTSKAEKHNLGRLDAIVLMSEEDLASLVRTKFHLDCHEKSEKVEELV